MSPTHLESEQLCSVAAWTCRILLSLFSCFCSQYSGCQKIHHFHPSPWLNEGDSESGDDVDGDGDGGDDGDSGDGDGDNCDGEAEPRRGPGLAAAAVVADVSVRASARSFHRARTAKGDFTTSW